MSALAIEGLRSAGRPRLPWDARVLYPVLGLLLFGLIMVYSASVSIAERSLGHSAFYLGRQLVHVGLGLAALVLAMHIPIRVWERAGPYLLLFGIGLLVLVLLPGLGAQANGSARWLRLGLINIQPSEFMKLFMLAYVAGYLVRKQDELGNFTQGMLMISIVLAVIGMLLLQEPDLGTVVVMCATVFGMLFLAGVRFRHFCAVLAAGLGGMVILTLIAPYRLERVTGFLDPWADPFNSGFQLTQALIAFGRGEWLGVGLGAGVQKLFYLPAAHTDFLLAIIAEETGLLGVFSVIAAFTALFLRAFHIARQAEQLNAFYAARLAQGIGLLWALQAMINMGVNMGMLPTKGLTLPFMSYGGSSIVVCCLLAGVLLRIERETRVREVP